MFMSVEIKLRNKLNINATLIDPVYLTGLDIELLEKLKSNHKVVITLEDGVLDGGFGEKICFPVCGDRVPIIKCISDYCSHFYWCWPIRAVCY